jgi:outer membrane protein assembly factor BamA
LSARAGVLYARRLEAPFGSLNPPLRCRACAWILLGLSFALMPCAALGQADPPRPSAEETDETRAKKKKKKKVQGIGLPGAYYRPDTSLGLGAFAQLTFRATPWARESKESRPSNVSVSGAYTLRHQYMGNAKTQLFLNRDSLILTAATEFAHFPRRFFGFGNGADDHFETFIDRNVCAQLQLERRITDQVYVGWLSRVRQTWIFDDGEPSTYLDNVGRSRNGGMLHGAGLSLRVEGRDHLYAPLQGHFLSLDVTGNFPRLGSEQRFVSLRTDARKYVHLGREHVLAFRGLAYFTFGDVPFYETVPLGRSFTMRGYYEGRYRDDHYLAAQVEYRFPLFWRIYGATFVDAGTVFGPDGKFAASRIQISGGGGMRVKVSDKDRVMLRVDAAVGRGTHGFVVGVNESF